MLKHDSRYVGAYCDGQAEKALPNGSRVQKRNSEPGDSTPEGGLGTIIGSYSDPRLYDGLIMYWVEWDWKPGYAVGTTEMKVEAYDESSYRGGH